MGNSYYYCCSYPLAQNSVIQPGNWGRIIRQYNLAAPQMHWLPLREYVFELVRAREFSALPSRLSAAFVCETGADMKKFMASGRSLDIPYEVELVEPSLPFHRGCLTAFDNANAGTLVQLEERARAYWKGTDIVFPELITMSSLRIIRRMED